MKHAVARLTPAVITLLLLPSCGEDSSPSRPGLPRLHLVQEVTAGAGLITFSNDCPPMVTARFLIGHGACDTVLSPEIGRDGRTVTVAVNVSTPDGICTMQLVGEYLTVSLGSDFTPGEYRLRIPSELGTGVDATFRYPDCN